MICTLLGHKLMKLVDTKPNANGLMFHYECKRCGKDMGGTLR